MAATDPQRPRRAAVLGSPIGHSRSPDLHLAAYRALGLDDWSYERIECGAGELAGIVAALDETYVGLSVTMPAKLDALAVATERTRRAELVGSANTLVRIDGGWRADSTDVDGMIGSLTEVGADAARNRSAVVIGAGGTALPTIAALADRGFTRVAIVARDAGRARPVVDLAATLGMLATVWPFAATAALEQRCSTAEVVVSTVPSTAAAVIARSITSAPRVVDVIYDPWPTPLADAVAVAGGRVVGGLVMLLNQAYAQVEQFTGLAAPRAAMAAALA